MNRQKGFSLIELLIVVAVIGIIAAIAIPNLMRSRDAAQEASAISSLRTLVTAQITYSSTAGNGQFGVLTDLESSGYIDETLASGTKEGYDFTLTNNNTDFEITAIPTGPNAGQMRHFFTDETGVIRFENGSVASDSSTPLGGSTTP